MSRTITRRRLLTALARVPILLSAAWFGVRFRLAQALEAAPAELTAHHQATLERMAYLLFPYPSLGAAPYQRVATGIVDSVAGQPGQARVLSDGIAGLDNSGGEPWLKLPEETQLQRLQAVESEPFFQFVLQATKSRLFNDHETWKMLGYEGSSLEFGGYLNHGLADIDWL